MPKTKVSNKLLGYPADARLLILNADDFGMCYSINAAIMHAIREGLVSSCSLMVTCPWSLHAIQWLSQNPDVDFGVHLTAVSEAPYYRWGPVTAKEKVRSLIDEAGYFYPESRIDEFLDQVDMDELELEFRAQIEMALAAGLQPTHLDSHCEIHSRREEAFELSYRLAIEYGLALRVSQEPFIERVRERSLPANDHQLVDSCWVDVRGKETTYSRMLRDLPPGLSEWAVHPGSGDAELKAVMEEWETRQVDYDFVLSQDTRDIIAEEGIVILGYENLQDFWKAPAESS